MKELVPKIISAIHSETLLNTFDNFEFKWPVVWHAILFFTYLFKIIFLRLHGHLYYLNCVQKNSTKKKNVTLKNHFKWSIKAKTLSPIHSCKVLPKKKRLLMHQVPINSIGYTYNKRLWLINLLIMRDFSLFLNQNTSDIVFLLFSAQQNVQSMGWKITVV